VLINIVRQRRPVICLSHHFVEEINQEIERLCLPALRPLDKRERMEFANESRESQVSSVIYRFLYPLTRPIPIRVEISVNLYL